MVGGLIISAMLGMFTVYMQKHRYEVTKERSAALQYAFERYMQNNNRLPCPADPSLAQGVSGWGKEVTCDVSSTTAPGAVVTAEAGTDKLWIGAIPVHALRVNGEVALDGWGNRFQYAVTRGLTSPNGARIADGASDRPFGKIIIKDDSGDEILPVNQRARYVVISAGPSGAGAFTTSGMRRSCDSTNGAEFENCNDDDTFTMAALTRKTGDQFYDDVLIHDQVVQAAPDNRDPISICNAKGKFYAPASTTPLPDADGCVGISVPVPPNCEEGQSLGFNNGAYVCIDAVRGTVAGRCSYVSNGTMGQLASNYGLPIASGNAADINRVYGTPEGYIAASRVLPPAVMTYSYVGRRNYSIDFFCGCKAGWSSIALSGPISQQYISGTDGGGTHGAVSASTVTTCVKN